MTEPHELTQPEKLGRNIIEQYLDGREVMDSYTMSVDILARLDNARLTIARAVPPPADRNALVGWGDANRSAGLLRRSEFSPVDLERAAHLLAAPQPTRDAAESAGKPICKTCGGIGLIGGFEPPDGHRDDPCPDCNPAGVARDIVTEWLGMFDPPPQIDFQQSELLQGAIASALGKARTGTASPQPAPDAMREAWTREEQLPKFDYCCHGIERRDCEQCSRAISAPVPSPDGARAAILANMIEARPDLPLMPDDWRLIKSALRSFPPSATGAAEPVARCPICDWPMATEQAKGCIPGDCCYRPDDPAEQERIRKRRAELATPPVRGDQPIDLDAFRPFANFISDPLFKQIPDEEILTAGSALTRSRITFGELRELSREMPRLRVRGEREIPPVERIECVKFDSNLAEVPADPVWRLEINGVCADFPTETWANNFRNAILSLPVQPGAGEREAIIEQCAKIAEETLVGHTLTPGGLARQDEAEDIAARIRALSRQVPQSSSREG